MGHTWDRYVSVKEVAAYIQILYRLEHHLEKNLLQTSGEAFKTWDKVINQIIQHSHHFQFFVDWYGPGSQSFKSIYI